MADFAGIDRSTYSSYEEDGRDYYPIDKIAELFSVPVTELLDEFNLGTSDLIIQFPISIGQEK